MSLTYSLLQEVTYQRSPCEPFSTVLQNLLLAASLATPLRSRMAVDEIRILLSDLWIVVPRDLRSSTLRYFCLRLSQLHHWV
jgi:hypothetical protein